MFKEFLKKSLWTDMLISIIFFIVGFLFCFFPDVIKSLITIILGAILLIIGALKLIDYFAMGRTDKYLLAIGIVSIIAGIVVMCCGNVVLSVFRIVLAIWIIYSGVVNIQTTWMWKGNKSAPWYTSLILSIAMIALGIIALFNQNAISQTIGIIIIIYSVVEIASNLIFMKNINKSNL